MNNLDEGEVPGDIINRAIAYALEEGIPLDLNIGVDSNVFKEIISGNSGYLFLDENCHLAVNTNIAFVAYDLRDEVRIDRTRTRMMYKCHLLGLFLLIILCVILLIGVAVSFFIYANKRDGLFDVLFGYNVYISVWILPVWGLSLVYSFFGIMNVMFEKIDYLTDTTNVRSRLNRIANATKKCWLKSMS